MRNRIALLVLLVLGLVVCPVNAELLFSDNFDSYESGINLGDIEGWSTEIDAATLGWVRTDNGMIKSQNNYWGSSALFKCYADTINQADYTVKVDGMKFPGYNGYFNVLGRVSGDDYVYANVLPSSGGLYLRVGDSQGAKVGDYYFAAFDETMPVTMELDLQGSTVTATAYHGSASQTLSFETTVTGAGSPGFGGQGNQWVSYCVVYFDNFEVYGETAVIHFPGDANDDGMVDVGDLGILAANYGTTTGATWEMGDFNSDGAVDVGDLGILAGNYGTSAEAASVPEPVSLVLLSAGGLLLRRRR